MQCTALRSWPRSFKAPWISTASARARTPRPWCTSCSRPSQRYVMHVCRIKLAPWVTVYGRTSCFLGAAGGAGVAHGGDRQSAGPYPARGTPAVPARGHGRQRRLAGLGDLQLPRAEPAVPVAEGRAGAVHVGVAWTAVNTSVALCIVSTSITAMNFLHLGPTGDGCYIDCMHDGA